MKDPDDDDLAEFDLEDFEVYLGISTSPFDKLVNKYSRGESKDVLRWIAENEDVAELLEDKDDEFKILYKFLEDIAPDGDKGENMYKYFVAKIDGGDKLMEVVIDSGNEEAHNWFLDFINSNNDPCNNSVTKASFYQYCKIGDSIDTDLSDEWLSFEEFDEYIENIVDEEVNGHSNTFTNPKCWDTDDIYDVGDVNDWVDDLCKPDGNNFPEESSACGNG